jgi:hypothetical protein
MATEEGVEEDVGVSAGVGAQEELAEEAQALNKNFTGQRRQVDVLDFA